MRLLRSTFSLQSLKRRKRLLFPCFFNDAATSRVAAQGGVEADLGKTEANSAKEGSLEFARDYSFEEERDFGLGSLKSLGYFHDMPSHEEAVELLSSEALQWSRGGPNFRTDFFLRKRVYHLSNMFLGLNLRRRDPVYQKALFGYRALLEYRDFLTCSQSKLHFLRPSPEVGRRFIKEAEDIHEELFNEVHDPNGLYSISLKIISLRVPEVYRLAIPFLLRLSESHEFCLEFGDKSEFQIRNSVSNVSTAISMCKRGGMQAWAEKIFSESREKFFELEGRKDFPMKWERLDQTPAIYLPFMRAQNFWSPPEHPLVASFTSLLQSLHSDLIDKIERNFRAVRAASEVYWPQLTSWGGELRVFSIFDRKELKDVAELLLSPLCQQLVKSLPGLNHHLGDFKGLPYIMPSSEMIHLWTLKPGTSLQTHAGATNAKLNFVLCIAGGGEGKSSITVGGETRIFENGQVLTFDDSIDHSFSHGGAEDLWLLVLGVMHPDLIERPGLYARAFNSQTEYEPIRPIRMLQFREEALRSGVPFNETDQGARVRAMRGKLTSPHGY